MTDGFRLGLRVPDVHAAAAFYRGLGFEEKGVLPNDAGEPVLVILERGAATLVVDALVGLPSRIPSESASSNADRAVSGS